MEQASVTNTYHHPQTAPFDVDTMIEMTTPATEVVKTFNSALVENLGAYQREWFGFLNQRWQENIALPVRLVTCRSLPEVQQVYAEYWKRATEQYGTELSHVVEQIQHKAGVHEIPGNAAQAGKPVAPVAASTKLPQRH